MLGSWVKRYESAVTESATVRRHHERQADLLRTRFSENYNPPRGPERWIVASFLAQRAFEHRRYGRSGGEILPLQFVSMA
jgi:hypothetical protein